MKRCLAFSVTLTVAVLGRANVADAAPTSLAITYFTNNTGDAAFDPLGRGLADMLITDLSHVDTIQVVERQRLNDVLDELKLGETKFIDPKTASKMGEGLGAKYIVTGAFISIDPALRIDGRVVEVATSKVVFSTKVEGKKQELFLLEKELASALLDGIGVKASRRAAAKMGRVATESFDAFSSWSSGLAALDRGDIEAAKKALQAALAADDRFDAAKSLLAGIREDIGRISEQRRVTVEKNVERLIARIDEIAKNKGPYDELGPALTTLSTNLPGSARDLKRATGKILELKLPDSVRYSMGTRGEPLNSMALALYVMASVQLRANADVVSYGREHMKRYPSSMYFQSTRMSVERALTELEKKDQGKRSLAGIEKASDMYRAEMHCGRHQLEAPKIEACRKFLELAMGTEEEDDAVSDLISAMRNVTSMKTMQAIVAQVSKTKDGAIAKDRAERNVKVLQRKLDRVDHEVRGPIEDDCFRNPDADASDRACSKLLSMKIDERLTKRVQGQQKRNTRRSPPRDPERAQERFERQLERSYRDAAKALFGVGRDREAFAKIEEGLARLPKADDLHEIAVDFAVARFDVPRAKKALARWKKINAKVNPRTDKEVKELASKKFDPKEIEPLVLQRYGSELSRAGQNERAAEVYIRVAKEFPETEYVPHRRMWMMAGTELSNAGRIKDARKAYERVVEQWPGTSEAEASRTLLSVLPE
ncbi:MAG: CsgG/HfaB family protein [Deltaproteobacteria bacterium]|jgi:TolB-like protein/tetratricopeptide (TPR) repeat protein